MHDNQVVIFYCRLKRPRLEPTKKQTMVEMVVRLKKTDQINVRDKVIFPLLLPEESVQLSCNKKGKEMREKEGIRRSQDLKEKKSREIIGYLKSATGDRIQGKKLRIKTPPSARGRVCVMDLPIPAGKSKNGKGKTMTFSFRFCLDLRSFLNDKCGVLRCSIKRGFTEVSSRNPERMELNRSSGEPEKNSKCEFSGIFQQI